MSEETTDTPPLPLTVVLPCFNEEASLERAYREIVTELDRPDLELLIVDDGSTDATLPTIRALADSDPRVSYLSFARNYGFEAAFSAGFRYARQPWCLQIDADLQFPPAEAHKLLARAAEGYDGVYGVREQRHDPLVRRLGSLAHHLLAGRLLGIPIPRGATTFRVIRTSVARRIVDLRHNTPYFMATLPTLTDRYTTVGVDHQAREHGRSRFGLLGLVGHTLRLCFGFSGRIATGAALSAVLATAAVLLTLVLVATPVLGTSGGVVAVLAAQAVTMLLSAVVLRYLVIVLARQAKPVLFCVREANIPVDPADHLYGSEPVPTGSVPDVLPFTPSLPARRATAKGSM